MKRLRENKKLSTTTRAEIKEQRKKWRVAKERQKNRMDPEKKAEQLEKRRHKYHLKRLKEGNKVPGTPKKFADIVESLLAKASPKKIAELKTRGIQFKAIQVEEKEETVSTEDVAKTVFVKIKDRIASLKETRKMKPRGELRVLVKAVGSRRHAVVKKLGMR